VTAGAFGGSASSRIKTQCLTDFFSVTGSGSGAPPTICGTNSNQHGKNHFERIMKLNQWFLAILFRNLNICCQQDRRYCKNNFKQKVEIKLRLTLLKKI
jgi:hypothetical protein